MRGSSRKAFSACLIGMLACLASVAPLLNAQVQETGKIIGQIRVARGDFPSERVLVELEFRGAVIQSAFSDSQGRFGFYSLQANLYKVVVRDDQYQPVSVSTNVVPSLSMANIVEIVLAAKEKPAPDLRAPRRSGSNPNMVDLRDYAKRFPKDAVKQYEKGLAADKAGKQGNAVRYYQRALELAPDFYEARNNLGSAYLAVADFPAARAQFEQVIRLNQSDAAAYFNLGNVCTLTQQYAEAQRYLDEGLKREPGSALGRFLVGSLYTRTSRFPEAEKALRSAIEADPLLAQARLQLVNLYLAQHRREDAALALRDFIKAFPEDSHNAQAKALLQRLENGPALGGPQPN
jgi:Flp pilus assembly protein TadD